MVSRVEVFVIAGIVLFGISGSEVVQSILDKNITKEYKILEMKSVKLYNADTTGIQMRASSSHLVKYANRTEFANLELSSSQLTIQADLAIEQNNTIKLDHKAKLYKQDGTAYHSTDAIYNTHTNSLQIQGEFAITKNNTEVKGSHLIYDALQQEVSGESVTGKYSIK